MQKRKWIAMMLAGGKGTRLNLLTHNIVKPAIPFGGKYRIIDFALSNCVNSGIDAIGILTQYRPLTLHAHLGSCSHWNLYDRYGGITILPPYQRGDSGIEWYEGTSHAVYQNLEFMEQYNPDYVLILSADQVYKMDYRLLLEHHIRTNADCTIGAVEVPWKDASRFGILKIDEEQKIVEFEEKPSRPSSNLASMGIYIFNWHVLKHFLLRDEEKVRTSRDFGKDIIPTMYEEGMRLFAYPFKGYWKDVGTVHSYWEANLDLLSRETNIFLEYPEWKIHSVERDEPPLFLDDSAKVHHSLLCDGCDIAGTVEQSVLFNGVKVGKGARIKNSVIMPKTVIEENVWIENAVVGSQSIIKSGVIIVSKNPEENLMVVGNHATIDPGVKEYLMNDSVQSVIS